MAQKTVGNILTEVAERVDDESNRRFPLTTLRAWIEEGEKELLRRTECMRAETTIAVTAGLQTVTGPTDLVRIYHAQYEPTADAQIYPLEYRDRKSMDPLWGTHQGISTSAYPAYYTTWGVAPTLSIMMAPIPSEAGNLRVFYYRLPATISRTGTDDTDALDVPAGWEDLITTYVEARCYRKDGRVEDYQRAIQDFQEGMIALAETSVRYMDAPGQIDYAPGWPGFLGDGW